MNIFDKIESIKQKNDDLLKQEYKKLNTKLGEFRGGSLGEISTIIVIIKIGLLTIGTTILGYWPYVFMITIYCMFKEYEISSKTDTWGFSMFLNILWAFCCPCCWSVYRLLNGFSNRGYRTDGLFKILNKCEGAGFMINIEDMGNGKYESTEECIRTIFK